MPNARDDERDLQLVLSSATEITGSEERAREWMTTPLAVFGGQTLEAVVAAGRTDAVLAYLESMGEGFIG